MMIIYDACEINASKKKIFIVYATILYKCCNFNFQTNKEIKLVSFYKI